MVLKTRSVYDGTKMRSVYDGTKNALCNYDGTNELAVITMGLRNVLQDRVDIYCLFKIH